MVAEGAWAFSAILLLLTTRQSVHNPRSKQVAKSKPSKNTTGKKDKSGINPPNKDGNDVRPQLRQNPGQNAEAATRVVSGDAGKTGSKSGGGTRGGGKASPENYEFSVYDEGGLDIVSVGLGYAVEQIMKNNGLEDCLKKHFPKDLRIIALICEWMLQTGGSIEPQDYYLKTMFLPDGMKAYEEFENFWKRIKASDIRGFLDDWKRLKSVKSDDYGEMEFVNYNGGIPSGLFSPQGSGDACEQKPVGVAILFSVGNNIPLDYMVVETKMEPAPTGWSRTFRKFPPSWPKDTAIFITEHFPDEHDIKRISDNDTRYVTLAKLSAPAIKNSFEEIVNVLMANGDPIEGREDLGAVVFKYLYAPSRYFFFKMSDALEALYNPEEYILKMDGLNYSASEALRDSEKIFWKMDGLNCFALKTDWSWSSPDDLYWAWDMERDAGVFFYKLSGYLDPNEPPGSEGGKNLGATFCAFIAMILNRELTEAMRGEPWSRLENVREVIADLNTVQIAIQGKEKKIWMLPIPDHAGDVLGPLEVSWEESDVLAHVRSKFKPLRRA